MLDGIFIDEEDDVGAFVMMISISAVFFTVVSVLLAGKIVPFQVGQVNYGGLIAVFLATLSLSYPLTNYLRDRDHEEIANNWKETSILERHFEEMSVYVGLFFAATIGFGISSFFMSDGFFTIQSMVLEGIRGNVTGNITAATSFYTIFMNNLMVLGATFGLSFFISGGMLFILLWNASVLGVLVGTISSSVAHIPIELMPYVVHGSVEVAAYVFAGFAGTLLAYHFEHYYVRGNHTKHSFRKVVADSIMLALLGVVAVLIGAVLETGYPLTLL